MTDDKKRDKVYDSYLNVEPDLKRLEDFRQQLEMMEASLEMQFRFQTMRARIMRKLYEELIKEGFTPIEALQIAKEKTL